jgi:hypothetical protein
MTTGNTTLLGLALPVEGELDGTWGDVVNDSITSLVDSAVAGTTTLSVDADVTLTTTVLAANQARQAIILWTASNGATTRNITAPAQSKAYVVINAGTGSIVIRGAGPTTGVTVAAGDKALVAWSGSDFVRVGASAGGSTTQVQFNNAGNLAGSANLTFDGTTLSAAAIADASLTSGRVTYAGASGNLTDSANLTFDGTTLTANDVIDSSLTANKPVFTNGSKNLVSTGTLGVDQGGTGATTLTANNVILGNGTSAPLFVAPGTTGNVLTSDGTTWTSATPAATGASKGQAIAFSLIFGL